MHSPLKPCFNRSAGQINFFAIHAMVVGTLATLHVCLEVKFEKNCFFLHNKLLVNVPRLSQVDAIALLLPCCHFAGRTHDSRPAKNLCNDEFGCV